MMKTYTKRPVGKQRRWEDSTKWDFEEQFLKMWTGLNGLEKGQILWWRQWPVLGATKTWDSLIEIVQLRTFEGKSFWRKWISTFADKLHRILQVKYFYRSTQWQLIAVLLGLSEFRGNDFEK
jgi:hypothetical protein